MENKTKKLPQRVYLPFITKDLGKKMVFLGGPRQVGKTTIATSFIKDYIDGHPAYLNWDNDLSRKTILKSEWPKNAPIIVLDEIHKRKSWQTLVKGIWDTWKNTQKFLITGSARLNVFRKGGDSMMGRYHYYRIHPFSLPEFGNNKENLKILLDFGGFPEPLLDQDPTELRRWHLQRVSKLVRIDLRDLENVSDLDKVELLADTLPSRVGSPLSYKSLAEDLETSDKTVKRWVGILDSLYYCFLIPPFGSSKIKAIKKSQKLYLWDWSQVEDPGYKFENMVASHLLKLCDFWQDVYGYKTELRYIRDDFGREVDFVVIKDRKPLFAVECKLNDSDISPSLLYFKNKLDIPKWYQVSLNSKIRIIEPKFEILPFDEFCKKENLI
ncbi:MAG: ATPase [Oligoflexia bacterium]|nr:MAG: ATPase [Oligoflexia bacterium]